MAPAKKKATGIPSTGTVEWFDAKRGFGIVSVNNEYKDSAFVHISGVVGSKPLAPGQKVKFNLSPVGKGKTAKAKWSKVMATNLKVVGGKAAKAGKSTKPRRKVNWVDPEAEPWPTTGTVMWYDQNRGFGLIAMDNKWKDTAYIHYTQIAGGGPLKTGQRVACNLVADGKQNASKDERWKKVKATDLKVIKGKKARNAAPARKYAAPAEYDEYLPQKPKKQKARNERKKYESDDSDEEYEEFGPVKARKSNKPKSFRAFVYDMAMDFDYMAKKFQRLANKF